MVEVSNAAKQAATDLWTNDLAYIDIDGSLLQETHESLKAFIDRRQKQGDVSKWSFCVPGEKENDVGLILPRVDKDLKYFFHYNQVLVSSLKKQGIDLTASDRDFLELYSLWYQYAYHLGREIVQALDLLYGLSITKAYKSAYREVSPYAVSTLRGLFYPASPQQVGAKAHPDRSFTSIHFGDQGGKLLALENADDQVGRVISPSANEAVVFFGVKSLWLTKGLKKPLWHKATAVKGEHRFAFVYFCQTPLVGDYWDREVIDAIAAEQYFYKN